MAILKKFRQYTAVYMAIKLYIYFEAYLMFILAFENK